MMLPLILLGQKGGDRMNPLTLFMMIEMINSNKMSPGVMMLMLGQFLDWDGDRATSGGGSCN